MARARDLRIGSPIGNPQPQSTSGTGPFMLRESKDLPPLPEYAHIQKQVSQSDSNTNGFVCRDAVLDGPPPPISSSFDSSAEGGPVHSIPYAMDAATSQRNHSWSPDYRITEDDVDISPPDSPIDQYNLYRVPSHHDVSPIEEDDVDPFADVKKPSPIPQTPEPRRNAAADSAPMEEHPRLDPPSNVPDRRSFEENRPSSPAGPKGATSSTNTRSGAGEPSRQTKPPIQKDKELPKELPPPRVPWKGASGRTPMVPPIQTKFTKGAKKMAPSGNEERSNPATVFAGFQSTVTTTITAEPQAHNNPKTQRPSRGKDSGSSPVTSKPLPAIDTSSAGRIIGNKISATIRNPRAIQSSDLQSKNQSQQPTHREGLDVKYGLRGRQAVSPSPSPTPPDAPSSTSAQVDTTSSTPARPEVARKDNSSPDNSDTAPSNPTPSIMARSRPVPSAINSAKSTTRKPIPSQSETEKKTENKDDSLPSKSVDIQQRIDSMEARRRELAIRKENINTIIYELTKVIKPSSLACDFATREEVKRTVASLNAELDDIRKEDHELGMKVVRAYRKRDELDAYEASTLWVRRVTTDELR